VEKFLFKKLKITRVGINFLSVKNMCDPYRIDVAESKHGTQIAPSPNIFQRETYEVKNYICSKIHVWYDRLDRAKFACVYLSLCVISPDGVA
jgi:hypothetical protein